MLKEAFERMIRNNIFPKGVEDFKNRMGVLFAVGSLSQEDYLYLIGLLNSSNVEHNPNGSMEPNHSIA